MNKDEATKALIEKLNDGADFCAVELPAVLQQFLAWHFWCSVLGLGVSLICISAAVFSGVKIYRGLAAETLEPEDGRFIAYGVVAIMGGMFGSIFTIGNIGTLAKILIAPNVFLLDRLL